MLLKNIGDFNILVIFVKNNQSYKNNFLKFILKSNKFFVTIFFKILFYFDFYNFQIKRCKGVK